MRPRSTFTGNDAHTKGGPLEGVPLRPKLPPAPAIQYSGNDSFTKGGPLEGIPSRPRPGTPAGRGWFRRRRPEITVNVTIQMYADTPIDTAKIEDAICDGVRRAFLRAEKYVDSSSLSE